MNGHTTDQKIALITGANKGIGRATAEQLAALGMTVLIGARNPRRGEEVAAAVRAAGGDAHAVTLDVTDPARGAAGVGRVLALEDRAERADRAVRQRAAQGRHPGQRRRPGLRRHGHQQPHRYLTTAQGAAVVVRLATLGADGPTAGFFSSDGPVPW